MLNKEAEEDDFINLFGKQYGYGNKIDQIRKQEFKRLEGRDTLLNYVTVYGPSNYGVNS